MSCEAGYAQCGWGSKELYVNLEAGEAGLCVTTHPTGTCGTGAFMASSRPLDSILLTAL
jgi:hypothetical protein